MMTEPAVLTDCTTPNERAVVVTPLESFTGDDCSVAFPAAATRIFMVPDHASISARQTAFRERISTLSVLLFYCDTIY